MNGNTESHPHASRTYLSLLAVLGVLASMGIAVLISITASKNAVDDSRRAIEVSRCDELHGLIAVYTETPPTTQTGINLMALYQSEYGVKCEKG